jgi:transposase InsO family protein
VNHFKQMTPSEPVTEGPPRRAFAGQRVQREQEQVVRRHVVDLSGRLVEKGWNWNETADLLGLAPRTLRDWRLDLNRNQLRAVALGRPTLGATREERNIVIRHVDEAGPGISLAALRLKFTEMSRAELDDILRRYRRVWRKRNRQPLHVLHWTQPGAVWAIDFHGPRPLIDGLNPYLLAVRDLASGHVLLWLPVGDVTADTVVRAMTELCTLHGAPLVLKSDNGSAFIAAELRQLAKNVGVKILYSPPRMPWYNGSIEATIGSLKIRTEAHAARHGHPGDWTCDDAAAARAEANAYPRPKGELGPSPNQLWNARSPISPQQRERFALEVEQRLPCIEAAHGWPENENDQRALDREAISQALVELGYLFITRRSIPLPIRGKKAADIT